MDPRSQAMAFLAARVARGERATLADACAARLADPDEPARHFAAQELRRIVWYGQPIDTSTLESVLNTFSTEPDERIAFTIAHALTVMDGAHDEPIIGALRAYKQRDTYASFFFNILERQETRRPRPRTDSPPP